MGLPEAMVSWSHLLLGHALLCLLPRSGQLPLTPSLWTWSKRGKVMPLRPALRVPTPEQWVSAQPVGRRCGDSWLCDRLDGAPCLPPLALGRDWARVSNCGKATWLDLPDLSHFQIDPNDHQQGGAESMMVHPQVIISFTHCMVYSWWIK